MHSSEPRSAAEAAQVDPPGGPAQADAAAVTRPGHLADARLARGWSVAEVAGKLGMAVRQIDAIERGDWDALPGQAFVRGAIRAYAKLLQIDASALLESVGSATAAAELRSAASLDTPMPRRGALGFDRGGSGSRFAWIALAALGLIAIAMYFGRGAEPSPASEGAPAPGSAAGDVVEPANVALPATATPSGTAGPPAAVPATLATPAPADGPGASAAAASASGGSRSLRLRFERDAWVEVRDAAGQLLVAGVQRAGSERMVDGARPFSLVVGNSQHVRVDDGGREVELAAMARGNVARLRID